MIFLNIPRKNLRVLRSSNVVTQCIKFLQLQITRLVLESSSIGMERRQAKSAREIPEGTHHAVPRGPGSTRFARFTFYLRVWHIHTRTRDSRDRGAKRSLRSPPCPTFFFSPDVHYGTMAAFNNSDMFADVPSAFLPAVLVVARHCPSRRCDCSQSLTL